MILQGVDHYRVREPLFEGLRVLLNYRGEVFSPAYIQGISGAAFRIAGICPCAPTCSAAMQPTDLAQLLGYEIRSFPLSGSDMDPNTRIVEMITQVKEEIACSRPVLIWHAFTNAEWDVVCGYDEAKNVFLGRGSHKGLDQLATAPDSRAKDAVKICPAFGAMFIGAKVAEFSASQAEWAALTEAVRHGRSELNKAGADDGKWVFLEGLLAYNRWVNDFRNPQKVRNQGDAYCYDIYRSTHRTAAGFLTEIATKYPGAQRHLLNAAAHFSTEADALASCEQLLGWSSEPGPNAERNKQLVELLGTACDAYAKGIDYIELALPYVAELQAV